MKQEIWTEVETCPNPRCTAFELSQLDLAILDPEGWVKKWRSGFNNQGERVGPQLDGFYVCSYCGKPRRDELIQCPECENYFKGPSPNFPLDYECENCE